MSEVVLTYHSGGGSEAILWNVIVRLDVFQGSCKCTSTWGLLIRRFSGKGVLIWR